MVENQLVAKYSIATNFDLAIISINLPEGILIINQKHRSLQAHSQPASLEVGVKGRKEVKQELEKSLPKAPKSKNSY